MATGGFKINRRGIEKMSREIQREFDKHPVSVAVVADTAGVTPPSGASTNYYGPVVHVNGDQAQLSWGNKSVVQSQGDTQQIAPGFEAIAQAIAHTLAGLGKLGLDPEDHQEAQEAAEQALSEVTASKPDGKIIRRCLRTLKGVLAPVAVGLAAGAEHEAAAWTKTAIEQLSSLAF